jgi:16S rRNA G1207 methylase RsmC
MNKFYIIVPVVLLGAFLFFYQGALKTMDAKAKAKQEEAARKKDEEDRRRAELDKKASEDARRRQEERETEERKKTEKKEKDYADTMKQLKKEAQELEVQLANLRSQKEKANTEAFALAKEVENAKITRRNAELEIQRMVDMVAQRVGASSFAQMPPPPPPPKK